MKALKLKTTENINIQGPLLISPTLFEDERGFFFESWNELSFNNLIERKVNFVQDNHSKSTLGVIRGLHYQLNPNAQGKLVRCINGEIFDVIVDLRIKSCTFGKWSGVYLSQKNQNELWIPEGFAHGFLSMSISAEIVYKTTNYWSRESERAIIWNDKNISINWPTEAINFSSPLLSSKDMNASTLDKAILNSEIF